MTRHLPLPLLVAFAIGCVHEGDPQALGADADVSVSDDAAFTFDADPSEPGVTEFDLTPDIDIGAPDMPDIDLDADDDGVVEIDATPDVDLPDVDLPDIDLDEDDDGVVEIDATPRIDLDDDDDLRWDADRQAWIDRSGEVQALYRDDDVDNARYVWMSTGGFGLDPEMSPAICPAALQGADVEVRETWRGFSVRFSSDDDGQVEEMRQLAADLARQYTYENDLRPLLLTGGTVEVDGRNLPVALSRSYATVEPHADGVEITVEPRDNVRIGDVRDLGYGFIDELQENCGVV